MSSPAALVIASACLVGLPGWRLAVTDDPDEAALIVAATRRAWRLLEQRDEQLAIRIANRVGELFK